MHSFFQNLCAAGVFAIVLAAIVILGAAVYSIFGGPLIDRL